MDADTAREALETGHDWDAVREALEKFQEYLEEHEPYAVNAIAAVTATLNALPDA